MSNERRARFAVLALLAAILVWTAACTTADKSDEDRSDTKGRKA